jgi:hypothetical protein
VVPTEPPLAPALFVSIGLGIVEAFGHEPLVVEPRLVVGGELASADGALFSRLAVGLRAPVEVTAGPVVYQRWGPSVALVVAWRDGPIRVGGRFETGVSLTVAEAIAAEGAVEGRAARTVAWASLGPHAELSLGLGLSVVLDAAMGWSASPGDYIVRGETVLAEGRLRVAAGGGVAWRWEAR